MTTTATYSTRDLINQLVDGKTIQAFNPERVMTLSKNGASGFTVVTEDALDIASFLMIIHAIKFVECLMYGGCEWKVL